MPIDIKRFDPRNFDIGQATVGVVGHGYIGRAVDAFFRDSCAVAIYDRAKPELGTLAAVVGLSEVIFVAVPTPMRNDGSCHTGIVESVFSDISATATALGRDPCGFIVVLKSTVFPGFTDSMVSRFPGMRIVFSPEFLTEKNSVDDFKNTNRVIFGGSPEDAIVCCSYFQAVQPGRFSSGELMLIQCDARVAETVKLFANGMLATKVMFSNEMHQVCTRLGVSYDDVRQLACLDERVGLSHTAVPGPDGYLGYGGHCFPKDMRSLKHIASTLGVPELLFTAIVQRNEELRENKDWLTQPGRTVIDE